MAIIAGLIGALWGCISSIVRNIVTFFQVMFRGLWNLLRLLAAGLGALFGPGRLADRLAAKFTEPAMMRAGFAVLRAFLPTVVIGKKFITAYENSATALVTAHEDVREVVDQDGIFHTAYAPKMDMLTGGGNFFLGMQDGADYLNNVSDMRLAANRDDIDRLITPFVKGEIGPILAAADGRLDVPAGLMKPVLARLVGRYFGAPGPSEAKMIDWTHRMFHYLFFDFSNDAHVVEAARRAAAECRDYLDDLIRRRKQAGPESDDVLDRCLRLQEAEMPFMDDAGIRNNFLGMTTAMLPTISNATTRILDQLLARPKILARAQAAARADQDELLGRYMVEAFRFNPMNPVIFRIAARDHILAAGTLRQRKIPKGCFVFAANLSAMFDPWVIKAPGRFDINRSPDDYILWGLGLHKCFGEHISRAVMPLFLKEILKQKDLRRAPGAAGQMDMANSPFPQHLHIEFDPDPGVSDRV